MSETLYRKYRPQVFADVIGQERAVSLLQSFVTDERTPQSIILKGTRGTGKTTMARIFALELGVDPIDVYELDAASNNGVVEMRELINDALTMPIMSARKVYIFDEVHMFSNSTWSVLLKMLEEPPAHVLFVMATTDDHKIPETIISRSVVIALSTPTSLVLSELLDRTAVAENVILPEDARDMLVIAADGSFRNALVALETVIRATGNLPITVDTVAQTLSLPPLSFVRDVVRMLAYPKPEIVTEIATQLPQYNSVQLMRMVLTRVRMVLEYRFQIIKVLSETDKELVTSIAKDIAGSKVNASLLTHLLRVESDMLQSADPLMSLQAYLYGLLETVSE